MLRIGGATADVTIVEAQGLPYWMSASGTVLTLSEAAPVSAATLPSGRDDVIDGLRRFLPNLLPRQSVLASGFADGSALVEFPALLMRGIALESGALDIPMGGVPLAENNSFRALLGPEQMAIIDQLASERTKVASAFGVRNMPTTSDWVEAHAGALKGGGIRFVPDQAEAKHLLRDGVIGSLVPLMSAASLSGVAVPVTQSMVTLAGSVLGADVAAAGRKLQTIGIEAADIATARQAMDKIATGVR